MRKIEAENIRTSLDSIKTIVGLIQGENLDELKEDLSDTSERITVLEQYKDHFNKYVDEATAKLKETMSTMISDLIRLEADRKARTTVRLEQVIGEPPDMNKVVKIPEKKTG